MSTPTPNGENQGAIAGICIGSVFIATLFVTQGIKMSKKNRIKMSVILIVFIMVCIVPSALKLENKL
jgi:hypothetical protein